LAESSTELSKSEEHFDRTLVKSVEETITTVLGGNVAEAFGYHFYAFFGLTRDEIPSHTQELCSALVESFGVGGRVLERAICRKLFAELGLTLLQKPDCSLVECAEDAKKMFLKELKDKGTG
jgi:hypothetical protein